MTLLQNIQIFLDNFSENSKGYKLLKYDYEFTPKDDLDDKEYNLDLDNAKLSISEELKEDKFSSSDFTSYVSEDKRSPLFIQMTLLQAIQIFLDNFSENSKTYILKNCIITDKHDNSFNISGIMEGEPNYNIGKNIVFTSNHVNGQTQGEIKCRISDNTTNKYTLSCIMDSNADYELDNSITMINNDFFLFDFGDNPSVVGYNKTSSSSKKFYYKKNSGISAGAIVAIILIPIVTLGLVIGLIYLNRNGNSKKHQSPESTNEIMNINNKVYI